MPRTTLVGGVGAREGGSGSFISACGGNSLRFRVGSCAVILLIVRRLEAALGWGTDEKGFGDTRSFFMTTLRGSGVREEDAEPLESTGLGGGGGGT